MGYGGTKTEMERLLRDAEAIKAKQGEVAQYSIDSYADVVEAIHVVQQEMGITGTTMQEAEKTISGSINMCKAAWENWLVGLADGNQDLGKLTDDLMHSIDAVAKNVVPRVAEIGSQLITYLPTVLIKVIGAIPGIAIPILASAITTLGDAARSQLAGLGIEVPPFGTEDVRAGLEDLFGKVGEVFGAIKQTIGDAMAQIGQTLGVVRDAFASTFGDPTVQASVQGLMDAMTGLGSTVGDILSGAFERLQGVVQFLAPHLSNLAAAVIPVLSGAASALSGVLNVLGGAFDFVVALATPLVALLMDGLAAAAPVVSGAFELIGSGLTVLGDLFGAAADFITGAWQSVCDFFAPVGDFFSGIFSTVGNALGLTASETEAAGARMQQSFQTTQSTASSSFSDVAAQVTNNSRTANVNATAQLTSMDLTARDKFTSIRTNAASSMTSVNSTVTSNMQSAASKASSSATSMQQTLTSQFNTAKSNAASSFGSLKSSVESNMASASATTSAKAGIIQSDVSSRLKSAETAGISSFTSLASTASSKMGEAESTVRSKVSSINEELKFSKVASTASDAFGKVKSAADTKMGEALGSVRSNVSQMESAIASTRFSFNQYVALPHFSMSGSFDAKSGSVPRVSVAWYGRGSVFDGASIIGVGEQPHVKEMVTPLSGPNMRPFAKAIAEEIPAGSQGMSVVFHVDKINNYDSRATAEQLADMAAAATERKLKARGYVRR